LAGEGDAGAFEELCQRHCWTAWEIAYAINGDSHDAAQSVSEAFAKLFEAERGVRDHDPERIRAAILSAVRAAAIETARRSGKEGGGEPYEVTGIGTHDLKGGPSGLPIATAFLSLPERWRSVLWMMEVQGVDVEMAAAVLGVTSNGLAQLSVRARSGFRERYLQAHLQAMVADDCRPVVESLSAYLSGGTTPTDASVVDSHLDRCVECKQRMFDVDDLGATLRSIAVPVPTTIVAMAISRWKLAAATAVSVARPPLRLASFPSPARKPLVGAALGLLGIGIIGAAVVGGPLIDHGLGGAGVSPAAASPSEVDRPFQIGNGISPVFLASSVFAFGANPLASLAGSAVPAGSLASTAVNPGTGAPLPGGGTVGVGTAGVGAASPPSGPSSPLSSVRSVPSPTLPKISTTVAPPPKFQVPLAPPVRTPPPTPRPSTTPPPPPSSPTLSTSTTLPTLSTNVPTLP
jgi:DNA-directed RNA polymerase specialized sigma24 family protein